MFGVVVAPGDHALSSCVKGDMIHMTSVSEKYTRVVGVDTHSKTHTFTIVEAVTGRPVLTQTFDTTPAGLGRALRWVERHNKGETVLLVIEGIGSYGAVLAGRCHKQGWDVVEPDPMPASTHRRGKTDEMDSIKIARSVLGTRIDRLRRPRSDQGVRDALRIVVVAREEMTGEKTRVINALTAVVRLHDLGIDARKALTMTQITQISKWRTQSGDLATMTARTEATRLAKRVLTLVKDLTVNKTTMTTLVTATQYHDLLTQHGIGPVSAAAIILAWGTPGRIHSEAALAAMAGVSPIPVSSGNTTRHRLNRGGDRRLNKAFTRITQTRMNTDPATADYVARRTSQGRTRRDTARILKRYIVRHIYRFLTAIDNNHDTLVLCS